MNNIMNDIDRMLLQINEDAGRGIGPQVWKGAKSALDKSVRSVKMDYLNKSNPTMFRSESKYNFNNYYTLDLRVKADAISTSWENGLAEYTKIFEDLYYSNYDHIMIKQLRHAYIGAMNDIHAKDILKMHFKANPSSNVDTDPALDDGGSIDNVENPNRNEYENEDHDIWKQSLQGILSYRDAIVNEGEPTGGEVMSKIYDDLEVITIYTGDNSEELAIKPRLGDARLGFVEFIMDGMTSAIRGHVPQGVTIEEIIQGKFSRKAITPEQGTFINRVKDPTSDKPFSFRSDNVATLELLHGLIMDTFKRNNILKVAVPELNQFMATPMTRSDMFLYMSQEDFNAFEKGGQGFKKVAQGAINYLDKTIERPDF